MKIKNCRQIEFSALNPGYFNSAYIGPLPQRSKLAAIETIEFSQNPINFPYSYWRQFPDQVRNQFGTLLAVSGENISHHGAVSEIIAYISIGLNFTEQDSVVLMQGDYPSNILPWMLNKKRGRYKIIKLPEKCFRDPERLKQQLPKDSKVLNISHVMFNTGRCNDIIEIGRICKERDILLIVDVSQSFGGIALSKEEVELCDVIVGASYKWLLSPYGHAFAYWSNKALTLIENTHLSWQTFINGTESENLLNYSTEALPGARRFDRGQAPNHIIMRALSKSLELFIDLGLTHIQAHNKNLVSYFLDNIPANYKLITAIGEHKNILALQAKNQENSLALEKSLRKNGIEASVREGNLRLSFHLFNTIDDINLLLLALDSIK